MPKFCDKFKVYNENNTCNNVFKDEYICCHYKYESGNHLCLKSIDGRIINGFQNKWMSCNERYNCSIRYRESIGDQHDVNLCATSSQVCNNLLKTSDHTFYCKKLNSYLHQTKVFTWNRCEERKIDEFSLELIDSCYLPE